MDGSYLLYGSLGDENVCPLAFLVSVGFLIRCQNWEGGIGGVPGMEAHGGYTFCGLAALVILKKEYVLNLKSLLVSDHL